MKIVEMNTEQTKQFLTKEELEKTQQMHNAFNNLKAKLADIELEKHGILRTIDALRNDFAIHEQELIPKYGKDTTINLQTGEVTQNAKDK